MTDPLGIQILQTLKTIALQYHEEVDINLIEKIRIGFYIPQQKLSFYKTFILLHQNNLCSLCCSVHTIMLIHCILFL